MISANFKAAAYRLLNSKQRIPAANRGNPAVRVKKAAAAQIEAMTMPLPSAKEPPASSRRSQSRLPVQKQAKSVSDATAVPRKTTQSEAAVRSAIQIPASAAPVSSA